MVVMHAQLKPQAAQPGVVNEVRRAGFDLGVRCADLLSTGEFQHFERVHSIAAAFDEDVLEYLWTFLDSHGYSQVDRTPDANFAQLLEADAQNRILFAQGWLNGVLAVGGANA